ncbi:nucleoside deaminase [Legionella sainthelensi]|uniref:tRNA-specific adenosine deaminase n=1 Tax=Legionella sainthelensi TaxID=28087 RepID=A0A2H5FLF0_9GAMM|nr:nucleoside deaminase [Legionella sainthelensi]AUH72340.1 nucleoside deaminase [Legionella sainthelensi]
MTNFIKRTIELATENVKKGGRPFACIITKNNVIVAEGTNQVAQTKDPTAHAEIVAIREATSKLKTEHLTDCEFFILAHPCPMCLAAMYYCSPLKVTFITTRDEYKKYYEDHRKYFTLDNFYGEFAKSWHERTMPMEHHSDPEGIEVYKLWQKMNPSSNSKC